MKFYLITCERGHCGTGKSGEIRFAFKAENLLKAMDAAKSMPSVKHTRLPLLGREITEEEYELYRLESAYERHPQHKAHRRR